MTCCSCAPACLSVFYLEALRDAHEKEMISAVKSVEERMRADAEQLLGLERAKLAGKYCTVLYCTELNFSYTVMTYNFMLLC